MNPSLAAAQPAATGLSRALVVLLAFCCGAIVANIYYAQPIVGLIAPDLGLSTEHASLIVSLTQLGYAWACCCWCRWPTSWKTAG